MRSVSPTSERLRWCFEGAATGLAFAGGLVALSVFAVGSFRPQELPSPYWSRISALRTDTFGFVCFVVASLAFVQSEYLRLTRTARRHSAPGGSTPLERLTAAGARALVVAATVLVVYLSCNAVTHPQSLNLPATHLLSWPTESTLRAVALIVVACAVAVVRTQRIAMGHG
ncbi:MAG: hypothetical protein ACLQRH_21760 [Acidimicrobiales bacterium]